MLPLLQAAPGGGFSPIAFLPMVAIFAIMYFLIIRPQQRKEKARKAMVSDVKKGDRIVTVGGLHATVDRVEDTTILAQVDTNTKVKLEKNAIAQVINPNAPAAAPKA